jgi:hypothetical protein
VDTNPGEAAKPEAARFAHALGAGYRRVRRLRSRDLVEALESTTSP